MDQVRIIAKIHCDLPSKFGVPRQSGLADALEGEIVFEKEYRRDEALRGLEGYSHIWLLWLFSENERRGADGRASDDWTPTVRPPRLGGNRRMGVFATRSPFRPNPIGLSAVRLVGIEQTSDRGTVLRVAGADLVDGTPIIDIKPYLPFADSHPDAIGGFADGAKEYSLSVGIPEDIEQKILREAGIRKLDALRQILSGDPRPSYQDDPERVYGFEFAGMEIKFRVEGGVLAVVSAERCGGE